METYDVLSWRKEICARVGAGRRFAGLFATVDDPVVRLSALVTADCDIDVLDTTVPLEVSQYPSLASVLPSAAWYEREIHDTTGLVPVGHPRLDPLVLPLPGDARRPMPGSKTPAPSVDLDESTIPPRVLGHGIFTIPHGPVRSGVFESVEYLVETPGEDIPYVGIRVYAKHRGIEKRFEGLTTQEGVLLAERVEGVASVAHALAFSHAVEKLADITPPPRAQYWRVILAELERIANHLDVAMKCADAAGLAVAVARFGYHKENILRLVGAVTGSRFGRGIVVPGGLAREIAVEPGELATRLTEIIGHVRADVELLMSTSSFLDRLRTTGPLDPTLARVHGALGPVGRASGLDDDARWFRPYDGYAKLPPLPAPSSAVGDALARLQMRWAEIWNAAELIRRAADVLEEIRSEVLCTDVADCGGRAVGWAEAPQGEVLYAVECEDGRIRRCKPRSASFHNLVLFHDVFRGDIFTDFPFIEASFGLSIAGAAG
ncbi:MAG: NADH-quinone oxidoreductase subunit C [Acidothermus sp.]|nr:NADH-quinone oxidoreductase subunit C [Acidothermus sp.]